MLTLLALAAAASWRRMGDLASLYTWHLKHGNGCASRQKKHAAHDRSGLSFSTRKNEPSQPETASILPGRVSVPDSLALRERSLRFRSILHGGIREVLTARDQDWVIRNKQAQAAHRICNYPCCYSKELVRRHHTAPRSQFLTERY